MSFRDVFQKYIDNPETYQDLVCYNDDNVIIIKDLFPKSIRHYLVIPKSPKLTKIHPLDVFNNTYDEYTGEELYDMMISYVEKTKDMIIDDLFEKLDCKDRSKLDELKSSFIQAGVHSIPSLNNLHIHVMTKDFHSSKLKNKKHYNSFTTKFFVPMEDLDPMYSEKYYRLMNENEKNFDSDSSEDQKEFENEERPNFIKHIRSKPLLEDIIKNTPFHCTSCSKSFGNSMVKLKQHLLQEFNKIYGAIGDASNLKPNNQQNLA